MDGLPFIPPAPRVLMIELGNAAYDVLVPMAAALPMRNLTRLIDSSALAQLRFAGPHSNSAAEATLQTAAGPGVHGILDDQYLDHRRRRIVSCRNRPLPVPTIAELVTAADGPASARQVTDAARAARIWRRKPATFEQLCQGIERTKLAVRQVVAAAGQIDRTDQWRLFQVRLTVFDPLLHRLWNMLGIPGRPGGNRRWVAKTREAFQSLDDSLGELLEMALRREAAVVLLSPLGFVPFREKIAVSELLCRSDLLHTAGGIGRIGYRLARLRRKAARRLGGLSKAKQTPSGNRNQGVHAFSVLPADWRRTRAVALHGQSAALVYLNTPERFGGRTLTTTAQRNQAAADAAGALCRARHPSTGEPLFEQVYLTEERFGCDPLERFLPEVVGIPAPGFYTRPRIDRNRHLMRRDPSLAAARCGEGLLMVHAPGVALGQSYTADLAQVAPMVLGMLGLKPGGLLGHDRVAQHAETADLNL